MFFICCEFDERAKACPVHCAEHIFCAILTACRVAEMALSNSRHVNSKAEYEEFMRIGSGIYESGS
jgi:hypothetical protein